MKFNKQSAAANESLFIGLMCIKHKLCELLFWYTKDYVY